MKKMAIHHHHINDQLQQQQQQHNLEALYCDEEEGDFSSEESYVTTTTIDNVNPCVLFPMHLLEQDLFFEDEELNTLFSKEKNEHEIYYNNNENANVGFHESSLSVARDEAVEWILKVNASYGFSALTATLAVTYFDRFLSTSHFQTEKPWMIHLLAVTCISLAAKVEETHVPLLLDLQLQVQDTKYMFESKTIQKMELVVLSTLKWKMHPVTPLSFLDHIIRRLGLKTNLHWEFFRHCQQLLLFLLLDSRFVGSLPSVLATATMLHVIDQIEHSDCMEYKNQLLNVLKISKEKVDECYNAILHLKVKDSNGNNYANKNPLKRKYDQINGSPSGTIDATFSSNGSNDSWSVGSSKTEVEVVLKKTKTQRPTNEIVTT